MSVGAQLAGLHVAYSVEVNSEAALTYSKNNAHSQVVQRDVPIYQEWVAQLNGPNNAQITPRVQGYLLRQDYHDGFFVKKGQLLYEIDAIPTRLHLLKRRHRWRKLSLTCRLPTRT